MLGGSALRTRRRRIGWSRHAVQAGFLVTVLLIGWQFARWVHGLEAGLVAGSRPPGVEGFLPIAALLSLRHLFATGAFHPVHPAGLVILLLVCALGLLAKKAFCSWVCPIGTLSEILAAASRRIFGRLLSLPRWLDLPLRSLKYLLLLFFVWAVFFQMDTRAVADFLDSPYNRVADVKMLYFFERLSTTGALVLGALAVLSLLVPYFWCRYLCPYGALLGALSLLSPLKITRHAPLLHRLRPVHEGLPLAAAGREAVTRPLGRVLRLPFLRGGLSGAACAAHGDASALASGRAPGGLRRAGPRDLRRRHPAGPRQRPLAQRALRRRVRRAHPRASTARRTRTNKAASRAGRSGKRRRLITFSAEAPEAPGASRRPRTKGPRGSSVARIVVVGSVAQDDVVWLEQPLREGRHLEGRRRKLRLGGGGANTAIPLRYAGHAVTLVAPVGADPAGRVAAGEAAADRASRSRAVQRVPGESTHSLVLLDPTGERTIVNLHRCRESGPPLRLRTLPADAIYVRSRDARPRAPARRARRLDASSWRTCLRSPMARARPPSSSAPPPTCRRTSWLRPGRRDVPSPASRCAGSWSRAARRERTRSARV